MYQVNYKKKATTTKINKTPTIDLHNTTRHVSHPHDLSHQLITPGLGNKKVWASIISELGQGDTHY